MSLSEQRLSVAVEARYFTLGQLNEQTRYLWLCCHGYGQLARYFGRHFSDLQRANAAHCFVFPEGLSRFYLQGTTGRVGASWMTKEDRQTEIRNQQALFNAVLDHSRSAAGIQPPKLVLLGFSQGVATLARWISRSQIAFHAFVVWAGSFPPELTSADFAYLPSPRTVLSVYGDADPYLSQEAIVSQAQLLGSIRGFDCHTTRFEGGHHLDAGVLSQIAEIVSR